VRSTLVDTRRKNMMKKLRFLTICLLVFLSSVPLADAAPQTTEVEPGYYLIHWFNYDGAKVYLDEQCQGKISDTELLVRVDTTAPPYGSYSIKKEGHATYTGYIDSVPAPGEVVEVYPWYVQIEQPGPEGADGDRGWYVVHECSEGASVYFDGKYMGEITDGELKVEVNVTAPGFTEYKVVKQDGWTGHTVSIQHIPPAGGAVHYYAWVQLAPHPPRTVPDRDKIEEMNRFVSPVEQLIEELKSKGYTDDEITAELEKYGYGWDPETGACWEGQPPTPEEQTVIDQIRGPDYSPFPEPLQNNQSSVASPTPEGGGVNPPVFTRTLNFGYFYNKAPALVSAMNTKAPIIVTRGGAPYPAGAPGFSLDNFTDIGAVEQYLYPEGPVIGFGYDNEGYITVGLWNGPPPPKRAMTVDEIYATLEERARSMGCESIPVRFRLYTAPPTLILDAR
jgi:hypothetical protein